MKWRDAEPSRLGRQGTRSGNVIPDDERRYNPLTTVVRPTIILVDAQAIGKRSLGLGLSSPPPSPSLPVMGIRAETETLPHDPYGKQLLRRRVIPTAASGRFIIPRALSERQRCMPGHRPHNGQSGPCGLISQEWAPVLGQEGVKAASCLSTITIAAPSATGTFTPDFARTTTCTTAILSR